MMAGPEFTRHSGYPQYVWPPSCAAECPNGAWAHAASASRLRSKVVPALIGVLF
jgi:hypothetical protein